MAYKVAATIKHGTKDGNVFFDPGETITAKDVGGKDALEALINAGSVVDSAQYVEPVVVAVAKPEPENNDSK